MLTSLQALNQGTSLSSGVGNLNNAAIAAILRSERGSAPAPAVNTTTLAANALLRSSLSEQEKAYVASRMVSTNITATQIALAKLQASQRLVEQAKQNLAIDALRAYSSKPALPARQPSLLEATGRMALLESPTSILFPLLGVEKESAKIPSPSPPMKESLPLPPLPKKDSKGTFPVKLHQMLSDLEQTPEGAEIASFLPHGKAFAIHKPRDFVRYVMPSYFRMSRFSSFQRQLNLYDFHRITDGVDRGAYSHPMFLYGQASLTASMKRNKIKGVKKLVVDAKAHPSAEGEESR